MQPEEKGLVFIKPTFTPFTSHGGGCCFGKRPLCVSLSAERSPSALLGSREMSFWLDHNDSPACDKPWDGDITAWKVGLFIGPFAKRDVAVGGSCQAVLL